MHRLFEGAPYFNLEGIYYLREYFMLQLGYHCHSLIVHVTSKIRNDFMEMFLHHSVTVMLVALTYLMNYVPISMLVLYSHDISDVFVSFSRALVDTNFKWATFGCYLCLISSWAYTRLFFFPYYLIGIGFYNNPMEHEIYGINIFGAMAHVLLVLHVYWFILLIKMGLKFMQTSTTSDLQQDLTQSIN